MQLLAVLALLAQTATLPEFEVAAVKPAAPQGGGRSMITMRGGPGTPDPGQITYTGVPLSRILAVAYEVESYQISGPSWIDSERFDITAKVPPGTSKEDSHRMLQRLLAERFHLTLHHDSKELPGYELTVGKSGSKLKESAPPDADTVPQSGPMKKDANGFPQLGGPGMALMMEMGPKGPSARVTGKDQPAEQLARMLSNQLRLPVADKTSLAGRYDFTLEFAPDVRGMAHPPGAEGPPPAAAVEESGPDLLTAVREQLGLRLESKKIPVDLLVIDHVDKVPTEN